MAWMIHAALPAATQAQQQPVHTPSSTSEDSLRRFLQGYLRRPLDSDDTTRYFAALVDLNDDGTDEAIVYITGPRWCGTGGCPTLILAQVGSTYRVVTKTTITQPPIRVLTKASNGWRNIGVWVRGGGIQPGFEAELRFDGKTYPTNPSTPPARRLPIKVAGQVVIPSSPAWKALYH